MSLWRVLVAGLAFLLLFGLSPIESPNAAAPLLRQVGVKHHGFNDATLNDFVVNEEEQYLGNLQDRPRVETAYDQKKTDHMKEALEHFWRERGIAVRVLVALTPVLSAPGYVFLEFNIYRQ
jgi:hypothetical protein